MPQKPSERIKEIFLAGNISPDKGSVHAIIKFLDEVHSKEQASENWQSDLAKQVKESEAVETCLRLVMWGEGKYTSCGRPMPCEVHSKPQEPKKRWKPREGESYWFIVSSIFESDLNSWDDDPTDNERFRIGNCFPTREKAEAAATKVKELLIKLHDEV